MHPIAMQAKKSIDATLEVARAFPEIKQSYSPTKEQMSVEEIFDHLAHNYEYVIEPIADILGLPVTEKLANPPINRLEQMHDRVANALREIPNDAWSREIEYPDKFTMSITTAILTILEHDAHHRGQLVAYLRALGIDPPKRWNG